MKKVLAILATVALALHAEAGCGKKVTNEGTLKSFDTETKKLVVVAADGTSATIALTPTTTGADKVSELVGKAVTVVSEHGKAESVASKS
jgi:VCBS repeat-containing protein